MAATALVTENFKFVSLFFKSKDVMIFNGLIALGTVASQTMYNVFAFHCPCSSGRNYRYGLAAIGVPALAFFLIGIMMNQSTWDLVSECRLRKCRKLSGAAAFALMGTIIGRAAVAPVTWVVFSLLQGEAYTCALSEFVDPRTLEGFPSGHDSEVMARFPCQGSIPAELQGFWAEIERQLKYESQVWDGFCFVFYSFQPNKQRVSILGINRVYPILQLILTLSSEILMLDFELWVLHDCFGSFLECMIDMKGFSELVQRHTRNVVALYITVQILQGNYDVSNNL